MIELLKNAISKVFSTVKDIAVILETACYELENLFDNANKVQDDAFIQTCSAEQLQSFEKICGLTQRAGLGVEQRRRDVLITFASNVPYTLPKLQQFLNSCLGVGAWKLNVNYYKYKITVRILTTTENGVDSLLRGLMEMIPCHIQYVVSSDIYITNENVARYQGGYLENKIVYNLRQTRG